jgi:hypothetical protein
MSRRTASLLIGSDNGAGAPPRTPSACAVLRPRAQRVGESAHPHPTLAALSELLRGSTWAEPRDPLGFGLPLHELAACAKREATIVNDGPPMVGLPDCASASGPTAKEAGPTMKVAIDTRYDTLEEALAVVALAFGTSTKGATRKPKPAAKKATSGRRPGGQRAALAETKAADTATATASPSETTDPTRRAGARKTAARKGTVAKAGTPKAPPKKSTTRKPVVTGPATSGAVAEPGTATKAAASRASATRAVSKSASANGSVKTKRVAAKEANPAQTQPPTPANVAPPGQSDKIRAWARSQGMQVADAGRMSAAVIAAYKAHHN